jgi:hypothetical protein
MRRCDMCGSDDNVRFYGEKLGFVSGIHLCSVCKSCYRNDAGVKSESFLEKNLFKGEAVRSPFYPARLMETLIPRLLD